MYLQTNSVFMDYVSHNLVNFEIILIHKYKLKICVNKKTFTLHFFANIDCGKLALPFHH